MQIATAGERKTPTGTIVRAPQFDPITATAALQTLFDSLGGILQKIPLIGSLFRGKTEHVSYEASTTAANNVGAAVVKIYQKLPTAEARDFFAALNKSFYENHFLARWGSWWDGQPNSDYATWQAKGFLADQQTAVFHWSSQMVYMVTFLEDATRVQESVTAWYITPYNEKVLVPMQNWLNEHGYAVNVNTIGTGTGGTGAGGSGSEQQAGISKGAGTLVIVVLVVLVLFALFKG